MESSTLADLKAEVIRKQNEANLNKLRGKQPLPSKKGASKVFGKKPAGGKGVSSGSQIDREQQLKVTEALNKKQKLYDQLKAGNVQDKDSRFLVAFDRRKCDSNSSSEEEDEDEEEDDAAAGKVNEEEVDIPGPKDEGEEWIEYVDALGRTRTCMKKDLKHLQETDKYLASANQKRQQSSRLLDAGEAPDLLSDDMRREMFRQRWEQQEEQNLKKTQLHYTDVMFDEARQHGVGFYNLSTDESDRMQQMEQLKSAHMETKKAQTAKEQREARRKVSLEQRLKKVRDRKRLKMGLPLLPDGDNDDDDGPKEQPDASKDSGDSDEEGAANIEDFLSQNIKALRDEDEKQRELRRKMTRREWDEGKAADEAEEYMRSLPKEWKVMSQKQWVKNKRVERHNEFAPCYSDSQPSSHKKRPSSSSPSSSAASHRPATPPRERLPDFRNLLDARCLTGSQTTKTDRGVEIPPPCNMDYFSNTSASGNRATWRGARSASDMAESFQMGCDEQKNKRPE